MRKISLNNLDSLFAAIAKVETLYLPVDGKEGKADYKKWEAGDVMSSSLNTQRSPKDFFFPQTENLMEFKVSGKEIEVIDTRDEKEDFVVFGVRACDAKSFDILDTVFLSEPCDSYYANRREHATIVTLACTRPSETCFCSVFGIDATDGAKEKIKSGAMAGTIKQDGEGMAKAISTVAQNLLQGKDMFTNIDKDNVVGKWRINIPYSTYTMENEKK